MIDQAIEQAYVPANHRPEIRKALQEMPGLSFEELLSEAYRLKGVYATRLDH